MTWLEFSASIMRSLAWPSAVVIIVCILREPISVVIRAIRSVRYKDFEVDMKRELDLVQSDLAGRRAVEREENVAHRLMSEPREEGQFTILVAWTEIEGVLRDLARRANIPDADTANPVFLAEALVKARRIESATANAIERLYHLRSLAIHQEVGIISQHELDRYFAFANAVKWALTSTQ